MDAACKLSSCSCSLEGNTRQRFEPNGATLISHLANDWMQHFPQFQFLISDPGGCFVSNELREWFEVLVSFTLSMRLQLVFASWANESDRHRPDGSRTGGCVISLATEKLFGHGQVDDVSVMAWRSFKLPRKIAGSNNGETQALALAGESLWLARLA